MLKVMRTHRDHQYSRRTATTYQWVQQEKIIATFTINQALVLPGTGNPLHAARNKRIIASTQHTRS